MATILAYAAGATSFNLLERLLSMWLAYYYLDEASPGHVQMTASALFGVLWIGRIVDAITDPTVAFLSDRARSPLGRRSAFLAIGGLPMCLFGALVFFPPSGASVAGVQALLALWLSLFWIGFTTYAVAYLALMSELAPDHATRVRLATLKATGTMLGVALALVLSPRLIAPLGFGGMVVVMAACALLGAYVPVALVDERRYASGQPSTVPLVRSIRLTLTDAAFVRYLISFLLFWLGFNVVTSGIPFYVKNLLGRPEQAVGTLMAITFGGAILAFPIVHRLALRIGLRRTFVAAMALFAIVLPTIALWTPVGVASIVPYATMALAGAPLAGLFVLPDAIVSRVARVAAEAEGAGREAMYFGVQGFCLKITFGVSGSLMGLLFDLFGKGGSTGLLGLKLTAPIAGVLVAAGALVLWRTPARERELLDG